MAASFSKEETDVMNFIYNKGNPLQEMDPDKVRYAKVRPTEADFRGTAMGDDSILGFTGEFKFMAPMHHSPVQPDVVLRVSSAANASACAASTWRPAGGAVRVFDLQF